MEMLHGLMLPLKPYTRDTGRWCPAPNTPFNIRQQSASLTQAYAGRTKRRPNCPKAFQYYQACLRCNMSHRASIKWAESLRKRKQKVDVCGISQAGLSRCHGYCPAVKSPCLFIQKWHINVFIICSAVFMFLRFPLFLQFYNLSLFYCVVYLSWLAIA